MNVGGLMCCYYCTPYTSKFTFFNDILVFDATNSSIYFYFTYMYNFTSFQIILLS